MGLLGDSFDDPQSNAIMQLAGGLLQGNFGQGAAAYGATMAGAKDAAMKRQYMQSQMDNLSSEIEARKLASVKDARTQEEFLRFFGGGGSTAPAQPGQIGSGSFGITPLQSGMDAMPQGAGRGGIGGKSLDDIARFSMMTGKDLLPAWKIAQEGFERKPGTFVDSATGGGREYIGDPTKGLGFSGGRITLMPGAENIAALAGQAAGAVESAKAGYDPTTYTPQGGTPMMTTRGNLVRGINAPQPGQGAVNGDQFAILSQELARARAAGNPSDVASIEREIARLPRGSAQAPSASGLSGGGIPLQSDAEKAGQVTQATANIKPIESRNNAIAQTSYMLKSIDGLINHPGLETGTGLSGTLNPKNYIPGTDAKNFGIALDQIKGGTFLQAFESLKSGGAVSEIEGTKATNAIARLNTAQSTPEFTVALKDFREVMTGVQARQKAAMPGGGQAADAARPANPGTVFDTKPPAQSFKGKTATGPDGKRYKSDGMTWKEVQ